jgi:hypothetical protein
MAFEIIKKKKVEVKIYGQVYDFKPVKVKEYGKLLALASLGKDGETTEGDLNSLKKFISDRGIPLDVLNELETDEFKDLIDFVSNGVKASGKSPSL